MSIFTERDLSVPFEEKPSGLYSGIRQIERVYGKRIDPRSNHCWMFDVKEFIPSEVKMDDSIFRSKIIAPVVFPGFSFSNPIATDEFRFREYKQLNSGLIISQEISDIIDIDVSPYIPPRELEIMDPTEIAGYKYFGDRLRGILQDRFMKSLGS